MKLGDIKKAIEQVRELERRLYAAVEHHRDSCVEFNRNAVDAEHLDASQYTAAVKRQSMEVSRTLADLRRPNKGNW